ncbi:bifunctional 4-hydroxy-2-oxoglutarate aldolase/2-dehydro-3-deoxy-phosphogluconate aldolase [Stieleria sp. JC731]|uniref:bifunctional 4-hydroxy-2-oxoglutarate aldolase/2-dehydro-3-deoxy-phosphogluconate aldolase n=1 Tax=Pirellulaceae TaxID=2691357 RepID=UPI001E4B966A|nr:bifunctional 4-hydroxy-2-oxoglutarate aldolase/2-dehydro-3-deoxy-phosphogluconate aldolase [Stieleria sp. JC731]MCC9603552.1 bifunctional 4-hydroxy-2-oxoglutarate aldolase/2-dehydro-3-deoxy-phosphogluconate aldolase [Stieleria sp. JC731]
MHTPENTPSVFPNALAQSLHESGLIAVVVIDSLDAVRPLAETLFENGIKAIELTLRTPIAVEAIKCIRQTIPELIVGAGTVLSSDQVVEVADSGASFAVSPGLNPSTIEAAKNVGLPFAPGICTPSDIETAISLDCRLLKFFPAEASGGLPYLNAVAGPYAHLGLKFIPLGGIDETNVVSYFQSKLVHSVGGSWIAARHLIQDQDWDEIARRCQSLNALLRQHRSPS